MDIYLQFYFISDCYKNKSTARLYMIYIVTSVLYIYTYIKIYVYIYIYAFEKLLCLSNIFTCYHLLRFQANCLNYDTIYDLHGLQ